ncbi:hypothetical protein BVRB_6g148280 [Beta vulgaris subsp. vulgaris]|nr:hypothetical protein BVRB_6g148280 [Beta vulgaris subsp. vulgaris]
MLQCSNSTVKVKRSFCRPTSTNVGQGCLSRNDCRW